MGITFAIPAIMWLIGISMYLGFPYNVKMLPQRLLGLIAALILTVLANLIFARMTADVTTSGTVLGNSFGHLCLGINNGGIWFLALMSRMGVGAEPKDKVLNPPDPNKKAAKFTALTALGVVFTLFVWYIIQTITGNSIGSAIGAPAPLGNHGVSLMLSCWLVFWMKAAHLLGKCSPVLFLP